MQKIYKVAIIGGGSAGLMSAIELLSGFDALNGEDVVILERNDRVGKKLVATGNGQGNLCNENFSADFYYGEKAFINAFVEQANGINVYKYFEKLGIPLTTAKEGKIYPLSKQASAVLDIMRSCILSKGCKEITKCYVDKITNRKDTFYIEAGSNVYQAENVIVAVGGSSAKQFGTDGSSYKLLENFGHKTTKLYPSLVQLKTDLQQIKGLKGLKETVKVTAFDKDIPLKSATGEILFTEYGVSGNAVFQISSALANVEKGYINVEFLPELSVEQIISILKIRAKTGYITQENYLCGILNKRIGQAVIKTIKNFSVSAVANALKNFKLKVTGNLGFNYSQVTKGGIETSKINPQTYESKLQKGLYAVGEVLNVDGDCGGYNLTFAFVSAICSAKAIKQNLSK